MDENEREPPAWLQPIQEQVAQIVAAQMEPVTKAIQELVAQIVRPVVDQLTSDIRKQLALAVNAGIGQLTAGVAQQVRLPNVVASGGLAMPALRIVADGEVVTITETESVTVLENF